MNRRRELKMQYAQMRPEMGIFIIRAIFKKKCCLITTQDLKGVMNGTQFKLQSGLYPNRELLKDWKEYGEANFTIDILERLEYDKDESKIDYSEELSLLQMIWSERLAKEDYEFYLK